jgi:hypothetical protein
MNMDIRYIGSWELETVEEPLQLFEFARAYLSASKLLCSNVQVLKDKARYSDGCVVLFTAYHAVELFLKGMILLKNCDATLHHDIENLAKDYQRLYPGKEYSWEVPFGIELLGNTEDEQKQIDKLKKELPPDQLYRYPINKKRQSWTGAFAFEPISFMHSVILPLEKDFSRLEELVKQG